MPLIKTVSPDQATGLVAKNYSVFLERFGMVPKPFELMSASPGLQVVQKGFVQYFLDHPTLSRGLQALIRLLVAEDLQYYYCVSLNSMALKMMGILDDDQLAAVMADPDKAPLSDKEKAMLLFVLKALKTPQEVQQKDVDNLRGLGWSDQDIFDAAFHGAMMIFHGVLFKAFKMEDAFSLT